MNLEDTISITNDELKNIIKTGKLYFSHPVNLLKGPKKVTSFKQIKEILQQSIDREDCIDDAHEYFTYWEDRKTPLFDIVVEVDNNYINYTNKFHLKNSLSKNSIMGMYWLVGNKKSISISNMEERLNLHIPDVDLIKYTRQNYKLAKTQFDFV